MKTPARVSDRLLLALGLAVLSWAVYRSVTTAVTVDEAITYNHYASRPVMDILTAPYHPANQVLHTLLCRLSLRFLRVTEWSLRLPALVGLLFYFWAAINLSRVLCRTHSGAVLASAVFLASPFSVGWLPVSSGTWMGAACFLFALENLLPNLWRESTEPPPALGTASLLMGLATGFHLSFVFPVLATILIFWHFNFWGGYRFAFWVIVNQLILPALLVLFSLWAIPLLNIQGPFRVDLVPVVLVPGLLALSLPWLVSRRAAWQSAAAISVLLIVLPWIPGVRSLGTLPDLFHAGPEAGMPKVARALRDELRRHELHAVQVKTSDQLLEPMNFYRRRYALGAIQPVGSETATQSAEYIVLLTSELAKSPLPDRLKLFEHRGITLLGP